MLKKIFSKRKINQYGWFGDYSSWSKVKAETSGYDSNVILQKTTDALLKVKAGEAVYERDSMLFDKKEYPHALMAFLLLSANKKKAPLNIIDFGGSLGSTYYQLKDFLTPDLCASWNIVEQEQYVSTGNANFQDGTLQFYKSIADCVKEKHIDFVLLSGSVQYLEEPHHFLKQLVEYNFDFILFDRVAFNNSSYDRLTLQVVPPDIYEASYPSWFFHEEFFLSHFSKDYKVIAEFPSYVNGEHIMYIDDKPQGTNKGFYLLNSSYYA